VRYDAARISTDAMLAAIEGVGFTGRVVETPNAVETNRPKLEVEALPEALRELFTAAANEGRHVLIDVHGPG
jgi:hypothetical protein